MIEPAAGAVFAAQHRQAHSVSRTTMFDRLPCATNTLTGKEVGSWARDEGSPLASAVTSTSSDASDRRWAYLGTVIHSSLPPLLVMKNNPMAEH